MTAATKPLCFVDTETTSLDPHTRVAWEIAMTRIEPDGERRSIDFQIELTNRELALADNESLDIGGYDERYDPIAAISRRTAVNHVLSFTDGAYLVGRQPEFDEHNLRALVEAAAQTPTWSRRVVNLRHLVMGYALSGAYDLTANDLEAIDIDFSYSSVVKSLWDITNTDFALHTAAGDVEYDVAVWEVLTEE